MLQQTSVLQHSAYSHTPPEQRWPPPITQQLPSAPLQPVPSGATVIVHPPPPSQVALDWHWPGEQLYGLPPHAPLVHESPDVQALPSLQPVPLGLGRHPPAPSQVVVRHWLPGQL